jgi:hypothetical protein
MISYLFDVSIIANINNNDFIAKLIGTLFACMFNDYLLLKLPDYISNIFISFLRYFNIFTFQIIFYIILFNDLSLVNKIYLLKIFSYIFLYVFFEIITNKYIKNNIKHKKLYGILIKIIFTFLITESMFKEKLNNNDFLNIFKFIVIYSFFYFYVDNYIKKL